jgi:hypothetical protein
MRPEPWGGQPKEDGMADYEQLHEDAQRYYRLCDEARALGIPVDLDDDPELDTVAKLEAAVAKAKAEQS